MKVGFQTIVWGPRYRDLKYILDIIAGAGYEGLEFFQWLAVLGSRDTKIINGEERRSKLIGLSGGALAERVEFCGGFGPKYLYVDGWDQQETCEGTGARFTLGLHRRTHMVGISVALSKACPNASQKGLLLPISRI